MASAPDLSSYVDLRIYDKDPTDILLSAIEDLKSRMPDWVPREDNTEVMLLEALAVEVADSVFAINRLPSAIMLALMRLYGIDRDPGEFARVSVEFEVVNGMGYLIPARTRLLLPPQQGFGQVVFETTNALNITEGNKKGIVGAVATTITDAANGAPSGTRLDVLDSSYFVNRVVTVTEVAGGRTPESDKQWFDRGVQRFGRLTDTLVVPRHFELAAMERPEVNRARALDNFNADAGSGVPGDHPGHLTMALYGDSSALNAIEKQIVLDSFIDRKFAPLILHSVDPVVTVVNVNMRVKPNPGYANDRVVDAVIFAMRDWMNTDKWPWKRTVYTNEIIGLVSELPEVDYVVQLVEPAANVQLQGAAPLASLGTISVQLTTED